MGLAGVLAGLVTWRVQKGFDDNRKAELDTWCAGRARSLQQQFMLTADHVQALAGLATVFGGVRENPWGVGKCMSHERFVQYAHATVAARPWVHAMIYLLPLNHTDRAAYERQMRCSVVDMVGRPRPPADWYMLMRYWYNEIPLATLLASTPCKDARTNPSFGPQLGGMVERADWWFTTPYVLDNGNAGIGMAFPLFRAGVSTASPLAERQRAFIGAMAASVDLKRLASAIILDVLQGVNYTLEIYDVTDTLASPPSGPRLLYGVGELPQGDPQQVSKVIPPSTDAMLQPHRHKAVHPINLTDPSRSFQAWCRFAGADEARSWVAVVLGAVIVVVAALLAGVAVSVAHNTREARRKTAVVEGMKERTQRKEHNKSAFIACTAHELRTPIIGMKGMLEQLVEGQMEREMKEDVCTAVEEAERVVVLVNTVLDISKVHAGCLHLERLPFHPGAWLLNALERHGARAAEAGLHFTWHVDAGVPEVLEGDYVRLQQVLDSIVDNAIKFTASGGVCVRLQCLPPDTHIPSHLLSLGCLLADATPCCPPAAAPSAADAAPTAADAAPTAADAAPTAAAATTCAAIAPCDHTEGAVVVPCFGQHMGHWRLTRAGVRQCCGLLEALVGLRKGAALQGWCTLGFPEEENSRDGAGADAMAAAEAGCKAGTAAVVGGGRVTWVGAVQRWWGRAAMPWFTGRAEPEGNCERRKVLLLTCEDTGCGIAEEDQRDVFQAFMQAHHKRHSHGGSGLSLHISKQLVSLMGGTMGLLSTQGHGTTLHVALPIAALPAAAAAAAARAASTSTRVDSAATAAAFTACSTSRAMDGCKQVAGRRRSEGALRRESGREVQVAGVEAGGLTRLTRVVAVRGAGEVQADGVGGKWVSGAGPSAKEALKEMLHGVAILVVDDNAINRRVAASTLARYGAEVALAESGEAALRLLQARHSFRLVLMDLHMPTLDGFQTTARLRALEAAAQMAREDQVEQGVQRMPVVGDTGAEDGKRGWQWHERVHVVAMSADVDSTVAAHATEAGMDGAVQKPLNERVLLQVLSTLLVKGCRTH
ncbi:unnamed protein product [Closterium sp. Naga37s-1]|nr:unnamed protein product [Closterium sp. Naga37s-1]